MKVMFCGNGAGGNYIADRGGSCVALENGEDAILVDCGPGSFRRVWQAGILPGNIRAVFITHLHYDHALGLAELFNRFGRTGDDPPRIFGPAGIAEYVETCKKLITVSSADNLLPPHLEAIQGEQIAAGEVYEVAGFTGDAIVVPHNPNVEALSWRIRVGDSNVVVSGDLKTDESFMVPFAAGADLLVHEAYTTDGAEESIARFATDFQKERARKSFAATHSELSVVARIAAKAGVKRLALTHLMPSEDEALMLKIAGEHFSGESMIATPGESLEIE